MSTCSSSSVRAQPTSASSVPRKPSRASRPAELSSFVAVTLRSPVRGRVDIAVGGEKQPDLTSSIEKRLVQRIPFRAHPAGQHIQRNPFGEKRNEDSSLPLREHLIGGAA